MTKTKQRWEKFNRERQHPVTGDGKLTTVRHSFCSCLRCRDGCIARRRRKADRHDASRFLLLIAFVCGALGQAITSFSRGSCLLSIALGFIGALLDVWIGATASRTRLPRPRPRALGSTTNQRSCAVSGSASTMATQPIICPSCSVIQRRCLGESEAAKRAVRPRGPQKFCRNHIPGFRLDREMPRSPPDHLAEGRFAEKPRPCWLDQNA
jgi:hypothetical protein